jgi:DNA-binding response OmpR family regulator
MESNDINILIVDDEADVLYILEHALLKKQYSIDTAVNGVEAITRIRQKSYHVVLLDLNMQPVTGLQVLGALREIDQDTAVIILTAHSTLDSAINALRLGAFDYLVKPAEPDAIRERVEEGIKRYEQVLARRSLHHQLTNLKETLQLLDSPDEKRSAVKPPAELEKKDELHIDNDRRQVKMGSRDLDLTTSEYKLLLRLVNSAPQPVSPSILVLEVLGYATTSAEAGEIIKYHIHNLRQKIEPDPLKPKYIKTIRFEGYAWCG